MQQNLDQFLFSPALAQSHAQMQAELGLAAGGGVRHDADQRAGFQIEEWGEDAEQVARRRALAVEIAAAVRFASLVRWLS